ncbi:MAG: alanine--glyoxylate aminotransferase family protein [Gemmatimonadota bacterium]|jgi:alanine-glyoxylate transaminase/serine-glyoxylate transaminase/serine-pyruvate transaminase
MDLSELTPRLLLGPGPSPVDPRILEALARPTVGHLDPQFLEIMDEVNEGLREVFGTENALTFPVSGTGSAAQEAAMTNLLEPGDTAIVGVNGVFGGRLAEMARRAGATVVEIPAEWGRIVEPEQVQDALRTHPEATVVAVVLAETSTGVWQPVDEIGALVGATDALLVADAVTALAGTPVDVDRVGIDVCYSGTQKCLGVPPGLGPITFSQKAMERIRRRREPPRSWYLDVTLLAEYVSEGAQRRYHHTAPVNMMYALLEGLHIVQEEGLDARYSRHARVGRRLKAELVDRGFTLFAQDGHRLPQLTSALLPEGLEEGPLRRQLLEEHGIEVGGGLGAAAGKLWRIGLMGSGATDENVDRLLQAVDVVLGTTAARS